jgi:hypothetical protein
MPASGGGPPGPPPRAQRIDARQSEARRVGVAQVSRILGTSARSGRGAPSYSTAT